MGASLWVWRGDYVEIAAERLHAMALEATVKAGFTVEGVYSQGRNEISKAEILAALGVERGQPIIAFDPSAARARLEELGWVLSATVERHLPDAIHVRIVERRPMARWQHESKVVLVDREGAVIGEVDDARFEWLPLIVGSGAPAAAPLLFDVMASEASLFGRVEAAVWVGERRWNLHLDNGIEVLLPEQKIEEAWTRLVLLDRDHGLLDKAVTVVDLRLSDRLVLRLTREAAESKNDPDRSI